MSAKIRLRRMGKKKQAKYRIVVADSRSPRDGRFVENLGFYDPIPHPARLSVDLERVDYWLDEGAQASPTVASLVSKARAGGDAKVALAGAAPTNGDAEADAAASTDETPESEPAAEPDGSSDDASTVEDESAPPSE